MNINISRATDKDIDVILKLNKLLFEYEAQFVATFNQNWTYSEIGKNSFKEHLNSDWGILLLAKTNNKPIGYICGSICNYPFRHINPICEIDNMFILEGYRKQGVGKILVKEFIREATIKGAKRIRVGTIFQNTNAIKFYKSLGLGEFELYLEKEL